MTQLDFDVIEERAAAATPGPWEAIFNRHGDPLVVQEGQGLFGAIAEPCTGPDDYGRANTHFIAHAREDVPALVEEVRELQKQIAAMRAVLQAAQAIHASTVLFSTTAEVDSKLLWALKEAVCAYEMGES